MGENGIGSISCILLFCLTLATCSAADEAGRIADALKRPDHAALSEEETRRFEMLARALSQPCPTPSKGPEHERE